MLPASRKSRNIALNKALKSLTNEHEYTAFRKLAQSYVAGETSAQQLASAFFHIFPSHHDLFAEMASLLPNSALSNDLLAAASHTPPQPQRTPPQTSQAQGQQTRPASSHTASLPKPPPAADVPIPDWILHDGVAPNSAHARYVDVQTFLYRQSCMYHRPAKSARRPSTEEPTSTLNVVVWLRQDLRLHDNPALHRAAALASKRGGVVTVAYIHAPEEDGDPLDATHGTVLSYVQCCVVCSVSTRLFYWLSAQSLHNTLSCVQALGGVQLVHRCCGCITRWPPWTAPCKRPMAQAPASSSSSGPTLTYDVHQLMT